MNSWHTTVINNPHFTQWIYAEQNEKEYSCYTSLTVTGHKDINIYPT